MIQKHYKNPKRKSNQNPNDNLAKSNENGRETKIQKWKLFLSISNPFSHLNSRYEKKKKKGKFVGFKETGKYRIWRV